jgi:glycosyltransferase involved in cell wall biosynthesis
MRRSYRAAVVDLYSGKAFYWGEALTLLLRALGRDFVLCLHGGGLPDFAQRHPRRVRACLGRAKFVIAPSRYLVEQMRPFRADIEELPNALDLDAYEFRERERPAARLVWLRTFRHIYNPTLAPKVIAELARRGIDASLTMYGSDSGDGSLEATREAARQLGVASRLSLPGPIPKHEVPEALNRGDIFLNTTDVDNAPVSVVEAMAQGLCVVSTDVGGLPYLLDHGRDALLAPAGDAKALADAVERVLTEPELAGALSRHGRRKALRFAWPPVLDRWTALLGQCRA